MAEDHDIYARVTRIRAEAFELISELARAAEKDESDPMRTLALVRMQAVANSLGRIQGDLRVETGVEAIEPQLGSASIDV